MKYVVLSCAVLLVVLVAMSPVQAGQYRYSFGGFGELAQLSGGNLFSFDREASYGFMLGHRLGDQWRVGLRLSWLKFDSDTTVSSDVSYEGLDYTVPATFEATRIGLQVSHLLLPGGSSLNFRIDGGGGLLVWDMFDSTGSNTLTVLGDESAPTDFSASELFLSAGAGIEVRPAPQLTIGLDGHIDYLTGAGASFDMRLDDERNRWLTGASVSFILHFGSTEKAREWRSDEVWPEQAVLPRAVDIKRRDSDLDGVLDEDDRCPNSPRGVLVDESGCALDNDQDGVPDGLDDCPGTSARARGLVDIFGCPVDSDFDGLPDYLDACPYNTTGAHVDSTGCPLDSDGDGVFDGLDDCPYTLTGLDVDRYGCMDLSVFAQPMILNIDYPSGSFEVDPNSRIRLERLAGILNFVADIRLEINGYTDNIGTGPANKSLSEKRARRVRDFLVANGVDTDRITVFGRGETNFVASNQTAEGRAKNRRIEIVFHK